MIGRWGKAAALLMLGVAAVVDLGLAAALLDGAGRDLPAAWATLSGLPGPGTRLALAGREALRGGALAGLAAGLAGLLLGPAAAALPGPSRTLLVALARLPALTAVGLGGLAALLLLGGGPIVAGLGGFAVATARLGAPWTLAAVLAPVALRMLERAARRLDPAGLRSLATLGFGPWRRVFAAHLPVLLPAFATAVAVAFVAAAACLFVVAWPVPARQAEVAALSAGLAGRPLAALSFCVALALAAATALLGRRP